VNAKGQVWIAWMDTRDEAAAQRKGLRHNGAAVYYVRADDGEHFGANTKLADAACECCRIATALDANGKPVAFWRHIFGKNSRDHAMARLDGRGGIARVSRDDWRIDACPHQGPAMSVSNDGVYHFAWFNGANDTPSLEYARSTDGGKTFTKAMRFGDADAQPSNADLFSDGKQVYLAWKQFDGDATAVWMMQSADSGANWSAPLKLATTAGVSDYPRVIGTHGRAYLSWSTAQDGYRLLPIAAQ
jgi:hypothetical protein